MLDRSSINHKNLGQWSGLNSFLCTISSPRGGMEASQTPQRVMIHGATEKKIVSGIEGEYGRATFDNRIASDFKVVKIIPKFRPGSGPYSVNPAHNPTTVVIYEDLSQRSRGGCHLDVMTLDKWESRHDTFGYKNKFLNDNIAMLREGELVTNVPDEGLVFTQSPAVSPSGEWMYGREVNCIPMSLQEVGEDGYIVSEEFCESMSVDGIESRQIGFGSRKYPLGIHSVGDIYKILPNVGECVGSNGLLMALREYNPWFSALDMTPEALRVSHSYDEEIYVPSGARIIDIKVTRNKRRYQLHTPDFLLEQAEAYCESMTWFYKTIVAVDDDMTRTTGGKYTTSNELNRLIVEARKYLGFDQDGLERVYRKQSNDEWTIDVTFQHKIVPTHGFKLTGNSGNKGVIVDVRPRSKMPRYTDKHGKTRYADLIVDGDGWIKRIIASESIYIFVNSASMDMEGDLMAMRESGCSYEEMWQVLSEYYQTFDRHWEYIQKSLTSPEAIASHIDYICGNRSEEQQGISILIDPGDEIANINIVRRLIDKYGKNYHDITYTDHNGNETTIRDKSIIGTMYVMLLEKIGKDWGVVTTPKRQHFALPSKLSNADKYSAPYRKQAVRFGESEFRTFVGYGGVELANGFLLMANSPKVSKSVVTKMMMSETPSAMVSVIDDEDLDGSSSKSHEWVNHYRECSGVKLSRS